MYKNVGAHTKQLSMASCLVLVLAVCFPDMAQANAGLPMIVIAWPAAWLLLIPIVLFEAFLAHKIIHVDFKKAIKISSIANIVSTLIGMPITWVILVAAQMGLGGGTGFPLDTLGQQIYSAIVQSAWLIPYTNTPTWMPILSVIFLTLMFGLTSIWTEYLAAKIFTGKTIDKKLLFKWSLIGNGFSYGAIILFFAISLILTILKTK
jgi:hypothetical protein